MMVVACRADTDTPNVMGGVCDERLMDSSRVEKCTSAATGGGSSGSLPAT